MITLFDIIIIAIVEGLTEYLPISSTAHMIFATKFLGLTEDSFVKVLLISIQLGAILGVVFLYKDKFFIHAKKEFYLELIIAVIPALVLGSLFSAKIEQLFENTNIISLILILGGVILLFVDKLFNKPTTFEVDKTTHKQAFIIGFWQCIAMMPGVSRSAASIIGGMQQGLSRKAAAEFSFFLAVPTMCAATGFALFIKQWAIGESYSRGYQIILNSSSNLLIFAVGSIVAFVVAIFAIKLFITLVQEYGFKPWGWYRIIVGILLLFIFNYHAFA